MLAWCGASSAGWATAPLASTGRVAELVDETVGVVFDGQTCTLTLEATLVTDGADCGLLVATPRGEGSVAPMPLAAWRPWLNPVRTVRHWVPTTLRRTLEGPAEFDYPRALAGRPVRSVVRPTRQEVALPSDLARTGVECWLKANRLALGPELRGWLAVQEQAGREVTGLAAALPGHGVRVVKLPPVTLRYRSTTGWVPFSQPQAGPGGADPAYHVTLLAPRASTLVFDDGAAAFPGAPLCSYPVPLDRCRAVLGAVATPGEQPWLTSFELHVPRTARQQDLKVAPRDGPEIRPTRTMLVTHCQPLPVDLVGAVAALLGLALVVGLRRRRTRGRTSSASAPGPPAA